MIKYWKVKLKRRDFVVQSRLPIPETCNASDQCLDRVRHPWASVKFDHTLLSGYHEETDFSLEGLFNHVKCLSPDKLEPYGREVSTQRTPSPLTGSLKAGRHLEEEEDEELACFDEELLYGDFDLIDNVDPLQEKEKNPLLLEEFQTETLYEVPDDLFEDVTVDPAPLSPSVPSLRSQVHDLLPLPLPDPLIQGERQCRLDGYELENAETIVSGASDNPTGECFIQQELLHEGIYLENPLILIEDFTVRDSYLSDLCSLSPLVMEECTDDLTLKTSDADRSQLEELVVEGGTRTSPLQSPALWVETCPKDTLQCEDLSLETPLLPSHLSTELLTGGDLKPVPLNNCTELESLSRCDHHELIQSDIHFDLCCVDRCRFPEPEMNKVALLHLEKLQREWREVAVLKWNVWKVELNLSWLLHPPPLENMDQNQAVTEFIQNGWQQYRQIEYQETFHKENLELSPLELPGATNKIARNTTNLEKISCVQHGCHKSLHTPSSTASLAEPNRSKTTGRGAEEWSCLDRGKLAASGLHRQPESGLHRQANGEQEPPNQGPSLKTQGETFTVRTQILEERQSPGTNLVTSGCNQHGSAVYPPQGGSLCVSPVVLSPDRTAALSQPQGKNLSVSVTDFGQNGTQSLSQPKGMSYSLSAAVLSPEGIQSLQSIQDPFLDSPVRTAQNKGRMLDQINSSRCRPLPDKPAVGSMGERPPEGQTGLCQKQAGTKVNQSQCDPCVGVNDLSKAKYKAISGVTKGKESVTTSPRSPNRRLSKSSGKCLTYQLEDEYRQIITLVTQHASYFITSLINSGNIDKSVTFTSLTPDLTRFIVKEVTSQPEKPHYEERHRSSLALHTLRCTREMINLVCLESGLELLSLIQDKYKDSLKGCLETLQQQLLSAKLVCDQRRILHPKVHQLCLSVHRKLTGKDPARQGHTKILVILSKDLDSLTSTLEQSLQSLDGVKVHIQLTGNCHSILESLDHCNCMLLHQDLISSDFPWSQFSLVLEYEGDRFLEVCQRQNISYRHFSLSQVTTCETPACSSLAVNVTIMCSSAIPEKFVHILESKPCGPGLTLPHVTIDEVTSVLMYEVSAVGTKFSPLLRALSLLSQQFRDILIVASTQGFTQSQLKLRQHQQKLNFFLSRAVSQVPDLQLKVVTSDSLQKTAEIIDQVSQLMLTSDDQNWMSPTPSQEEEFLTGIPCINSIFAQKMLQILSLPSITELHPQQLSCLFPRVPPRIIQMFCAAVDKLRTSKGVVLSENEGSCGPVLDFSPPCSQTQPEARYSTVQNSQEVNDQVNYHQGQETLLSRTNGCPNQKDWNYSETFSEHSINSESPNEFVRAQMGLEEENSSYLKELRRIVDRQVRNKADPGTLGEDSQYEATNFNASHPHVTNETERSRYLNNSSGIRENWNRSDGSSQRKTESLTEHPSIPVVSWLSQRENKENVPPSTQKFPGKRLSEEMGCVAEDYKFQRVYSKPNKEVNLPIPVETSHCSTNAVGSPKHLYQKSPREVLHTGVDSHPLVDSEGTCPASGDFQDSVISTTRQLLRQASLSSTDRIFHRTGPRRVSIGLARPLRQHNIDVNPHCDGAGLSQDQSQAPLDLPPREGLNMTTPSSEPNTSLPKQARLPDHQVHSLVTGVERNSGETLYPRGLGCTQMSGRSCPTPECQLNGPDCHYTPGQHDGSDHDCDSHPWGQCVPLSTRQGCLPPQHSTGVDPRRAWPGYDSPPMDIEYGMLPLQDYTENFISQKKNTGSGKKLSYQRVPNSKQSRLVFQ